MTTRTTKITSAYLRATLACHAQQEEFFTLFGEEGVEVTEELALKHAQIFDWDWAVNELLEGDIQGAARNEESAAYSARRAARNQLEDAFEAKSRHTNEEYRERLSQITEILRRYHEQTALIFARAFLKQGGRPLLEGEQA
jgi:hypothetical protein